MDKNQLKEVSLQSSMFSADHKNKKIQVGLDREIHTLEKRLGMSTYAINREIRALQAEIKKLRKSSGNSVEGVRSNQKSLMEKGIYWESKSSASASHALNTKAKNNKSKPNARPRTSGAKFGNNQSTRILNKPVEKLETGEEERSVATNSAQVFKTSSRKDRNQGRIAWDKHGRKNRIPDSRPAPKEQLLDVILSAEIRPHSVPIGTQLSEMKQPGKMLLSGGAAGNNQRPYSADNVVEYKTRVSGLEHLGIVHNEQNETPIRPTSKTVTMSDTNLESASQGISVKTGGIRPGFNARHMWLKSALKYGKKAQVKTKRVTIAAGQKPSNDIHVASDGNGGHVSNSNPGNDKSSEDTSPRIGNGQSMLSMYMASSSNSSSATSNKVPDVRKNTKVVSKDTLVIQRKRDNLLTASVSNLLSNKSVAGGTAPKAKTAKDQEHAETLPVPDPKSPRSSQRRGSIRLRSFVAQAFTSTSVEQKSTLESPWSRLLVARPLQASAHHVSLAKSVMVHDSDSDDDGKKSTPRIQVKKVQSKISSGRRKKPSDKRLVLDNDKEQLKMHLLASRMSRERHLENMQGHNDVDPRKEIDEERTVGVLSKVHAFNAFLDTKKKEEARVEKAKTLFMAISKSLFRSSSKRSGPLPPILQKWRSIARKAIGKE